MLGFQVLVHAIRMVWRNRREALRIGLVPVLMMIAGFLVFGRGEGPLWSLDNALTIEEVIINGLHDEQSLALALIWIAATIWAFVNWHRFILLSEYPQGWIPPLHRRICVRYFYGAFRLVTIMVIALAILIFVTALAGRGMFPFFLVGAIALAYVLMRLSVLLPAAAVGVDFSLGQAYLATMGTTTAVLWALAFRYLGGRALDVIVHGTSQVNDGLALALFGSLTLLLSLVNASILTTIYGHFVEGRPLD